MRKTPSSSSTTAWWWWRSVAILQGFGKHCERGEGREVGLRQEGEKLACWASPRPQLYIGGWEGAAPPLEFPPQGVRQPQTHLGWRPREGEGETCPPSKVEAPPPQTLGALGPCGGRTSPPGAGPLPQLAHAALRGWWPHLVDPRDPPGGPDTLPIKPETFPVTKTGLPIYKSLPPDHSGTPRDIRDLIRDSEQHSVTTYKLPL